MKKGSWFVVAAVAAFASIAGAADASPTCGAESAFGKTKVCMPEPTFATKMCSGTYPELALSFFAKGSPWTRVYLAGDVEAWNASGGRTHRMTLPFDEEVIVLAKHAPAATGGIQMTGAQANYDVLRWDGSCVSVAEGELTTKRPPAPRPADVPFNRLEEGTRRALLASPKVKKARETLNAACGSIATPADKSRCDDADRAFATSIVDFVRAGGRLPEPARRPE